MGLALANYESALSRFPTGVQRYTLPLCDTASNRRHTMFSSMLPFMEQTNIYNSLNLSFGANSITNISAQETKVATYICPSDFTSTGPLNPPGGPLQYIGVNQTSYSGVAGKNRTVSLPL